MTGRLDIVLSGRDASLTPVTKIYRNDGPGSGGSWQFTDINAGFPGVKDSSVALGRSEQRRMA